MVSSGIIFFDDEDRSTLLPLTYLRPMAEIRIGIMTVREKWCSYLKRALYSFQTEHYIQDLYPKTQFKSKVFIKGNLLPNADLISAIQSLAEGQALYYKNILLAANTTEEHSDYSFTDFEQIHFTQPCRIIQYPEQIFKWNQDELVSDFNHLTKGRQSAVIDLSNQIKSRENIFIEEGAVIEHSILNATDGPIYVGKHAKILDGCMLKNGVAVCDNAVLKMGAKIYGATTIGPGCKAGGEIKNAVFFGNSNKSHDGYLGNSVLAEWCNLGADTNATNHG